jgi:hypothetical protein
MIISAPKAADSEGKKEKVAVLSCNNLGMLFLFHSFSSLIHSVAIVSGGKEGERE